MSLPRCWITPARAVSASLGWSGISNRASAPMPSPVASLQSPVGRSRPPSMPSVLGSARAEPTETNANTKPITKLRMRPPCGGLERERAHPSQRIFRATDSPALAPGGEPPGERMRTAMILLVSAVSATAAADSKPATQACLGDVDHFLTCPAGAQRVGTECRARDGRHWSGSMRQGPSLFLRDNQTVSFAANYKDHKKSGRVFNFDAQ